MGKKELAKCKVGYIKNNCFYTCSFCEAGKVEVKEKNTGC